MCGPAIDRLHALREAVPGAGFCDGSARCLWLAGLRRGSSDRGRLGSSLDTGRGPRPRTAPADSPGRPTALAMRTAFRVVGVIAIVLGFATGASATACVAVGTTIRMRITACWRCAGTAGAVGDPPSRRAGPVAEARPLRADRTVVSVGGGGSVRRYTPSPGLEPYAGADDGELGLTRPARRRPQAPGWPRHPGRLPCRRPASRRSGRPRLVTIRR